MKTILKYKTIILAVLIFTLAMYAYNIFFASNDLALPNEGAAIVIGDDLIRIHEELKAITLEHSVLSSPGYLALIDFSVLVPQDTTGRPNPFSIIGRD